MNKYIGHLKKHFEDNRDNEKAIPMKKYMKDHFEFLGIPSPIRIDLTKQFFKEYGIPEGKDLHTIINLLWELPEREYQYIALSILDKKKKQLSETDIPFLEDLITNKSWWDTIDAIAPNYLGLILKKNPTIVETYVNKWLSSDNIWLNRTAILFQLKYKKDTNKELLFNIISKLAHSNEFFIRKAIGWALREYSKTDPVAVTVFIEENNDQLSPLSKREGMKVINKKKKEAGM
ncbi:DNA alkylation repair protein [Lottiidibacillus patelloidae]|uniref:DNA alkylation repair protein n=1 Tax=Lottiidibacillus patelloidae TaxID=2670334 RepID=A0A263BVC4_9BACI|nr:DNA alkylation repair protein [Lottiidibacillus patelloidae]OZM57518.1 DNA alkylation repair protein [Lottiidibacillus patelloidae]